MAEISAILARLSSEVTSRVLRWAVSRYQTIGREGVPFIATRGSPGHFEDFPSLFAAAMPQTEADKALVAGYWFQVVQAQSDLDALQINAELRNLGHGLSNVTRAFDQLMSGRPQLAIQTRKGGSSKQARKKYRLTAEGVRAIDGMLNRVPVDSGT
jgi:hypothetical protein